MWPAGSAVLFQFAVVWQPLQSPVSMVARGVIGRAQLQRRIGRTHVEGQTVAVPWQVSQVVGHEGMGGLGHVHGPEGAGRIRRRRVAGAAVGAGEVRNVRWREHAVLRIVVIVVERQLGRRRGTACSCR